MQSKDFYKIIESEETATEFLRHHKLLKSVHDNDPCHKCGSVMHQKRKRDRGGEFRPVLRCPRKGCQTSRSVRAGNAFFHYTDLNNRVNCRLKLCEILELVFYFIAETLVETTVTLTGISKPTVIDWFNVSRGMWQYAFKKGTNDWNGRKTHTD